jgi:hypothetical protein
MKVLHPRKSSSAADSKAAVELWGANGTAGGRGHAFGAAPLSLYTPTPGVHDVHANVGRVVYPWVPRLWREEGCLDPMLQQTPIPSLHLALKHAPSCPHAATAPPALRPPRPPLPQNRYKVTKQLGDGTYGTVIKAVNKATGETVCQQDSFFVFVCCAFLLPLWHAHTHMCKYAPTSELIQSHSLFVSSAHFVRVAAW